MKRFIWRKITCMALALVLVALWLPAGVAAASSGDDGVTNGNFIIPVTPQTTVPDEYIGIYTAEDLDNIRDNMNGKYILMNDIDLEEWGEWEPIGNSDDNAFTGVFDGNGYTIQNLKVLPTSNGQVYAGLLGYVSGSAYIKNIGLVDTYIEFDWSSDLENAGGLIGGCGIGNITVKNCYSTGQILNEARVAGGIIGVINGGTLTIENCYSTASVYGSWGAGGLIGDVYSSSDVIMVDCYNSGDVTTDDFSAGGLLASFGNALLKMENCYNTGYISSTENCGGSAATAGGLIGYLLIDRPVEDDVVVIERCYNNGDVFARSTWPTRYAGGLIGYAASAYVKKVTIKNSYNTGDISITANNPSINEYAAAGGLFGAFFTNNSILAAENCYHIGEMSVVDNYDFKNNDGLVHYSGPSPVLGGIIGHTRLYGDGKATLNNCYYINSIPTSVGSNSELVTQINTNPLTNDQMRNQASFEGFDFEDIWGISTGINNGYPYLRPQEKIILTHTITVTSGIGGTVSGGGTFNADSPVTLTAIPNSNYTFDGWYENGVKILGADAIYTFTAITDRTLEARFTYTGSGYIPPTTPPSTTPPPKTEEPSPNVPLDWLNPYSDVEDIDWFYDATRFVTEKNLMEGTSEAKFSPNVTMSRAMLVTVLYRLEGTPAVSGDIPFTDAKSGEWYSNAILWASQNNIVDGYINGAFGINDAITREQAVTILHRYAKMKRLDISMSADLSSFSDMDDISDWALDAMKWAVALGIVQGRTATTTVPQGTSTRAEVAMIFKRFIEDFLGELDDSDE